MSTEKKKFLVLLHIKTIKLPNKQPVFTVMLNNQLQLASNASDDLVVYKMFTGIGDSCMRIKLLNKATTDTKVDNNNNIIEDLAIQVVKFSVEDIDQTSYFYDHVIYNTPNGSGGKTYGFMHTNGELVIDFVCPTFYNIRNIRLIDKNFISNE